MAYLKGGTVVDGNLYVEGGLRVKQIVDSSGSKMPHLDNQDSSVPKRLIKFTDSNAAISFSYLEEDYTDGDETLNWASPVNSIHLSVNNGNDSKIKFFSIEKESGTPTKANLFIGEDINNIEISSSSLPGVVKFNKATDQIIITNQGNKKLVGLKKDNNGGIIVNGVKYRELTRYVSEVPDIFIYKVPALSNA